jgi:hypothetical protein
MGIMSILTDGDEPIARKVYKFKQDALMGQAVKGGFLPSAFYTYSDCQSGVCAAISIAWIDEQISPIVFNQHFGVTERHPKLTGICAKMFIAQFKAAELTNFTRNQADDLGAEFGLTFQPITNRDVKDSLVFTCMDALGSLGPREAAVVYYQMIGAKWHTVALSRDGDSAVHFFDPNYGEYQITGGDERSFFGRYVKVLKENKKYELKQAFARKASKSGNPVAWKLSVGPTNTFGMG